MPIAAVLDLNVEYALAGREGAPVIVFSNSLGTNFSMWNAQLPELEKNFRVLLQDTRGEGATAVTPGPYTIAQLGADVVGLLDFLKIERAHFCGISMGGQIGTWLGLNAADRLGRLILCNTAAKIGTADGWNTRIENVRRGGMASISAAVCERWFTPEFRAREPETFARMQKMIESMPPEGYVGCCAAVRDYDVREQLGQIHTPALVISGTHDPATPPADGKFIAERIPGARYVELNTSHLSNIAAPEEFTAALIDFLSV